MQLSEVHVKVAWFFSSLETRSDITATLFAESVLHFSSYISGLHPACAGQVFTSACRGDGENKKVVFADCDGERVARRRQRRDSDCNQWERTRSEGEEEGVGLWGQTRTNPNSTSAVAGGEG